MAIDTLLTVCVSLGVLSTNEKFQDFFDIFRKRFLRETHGFKISSLKLNKLYIVEGAPAPHYYMSPTVFLPLQKQFF